MIYEAGQVWEWSDSGTLYALLYRDLDPYKTIYHADQERWFALRLEDGKVECVLIHSETFRDGEHWMRHS